MYLCAVGYGGPLLTQVFATVCVDIGFRKSKFKISPKKPFAPQAFQKVSSPRQIIFQNPDFAPKF